MHYHRRVPPFGYLRVFGYVLLTAAFRSLSRPSSAPSAKASALCPSLLDLFLSSPNNFGAMYGAHTWTCQETSVFSFTLFLLASRSKILPLLSLGFYLRSIKFFDREIVVFPFIILV